MATTAQAIERISEATGILPATVLRVARQLRDEEGMDLWPLGAVGAPGRGHNIVVYPNHLVNLLLGLSVSPITSAAEMVSWMRTLVPVADDEDNADPSKPFLPGGTLAEALEAYLDDPSISAPFRILVRRYGSRLPAVKLEADASDADWYCLYFPAADKRDKAITPIPPGAAVASFEIRPPLIEVAAELWADTRRYLSLHNRQLTRTIP